MFRPAAALAATAAALILGTLVFVQTQSAGAIVPPGQADVNQDGQVTAADLSLVASASDRADVNGDGVVDDADLQFVAAHMGEQFDDPAATVTAMPTAAAMATAAVGAACVSNCGDPRNFCDSWSGGFCDDFRRKASGSTQLPFPATGDPYSFSCMSSTNTASAADQPYYDPSMNRENFADGSAPALLPFPCAFSANEHFMTRIEDGQFGMATLRLHQPFDITNREGHVHFDIDLKTSARRYVRFLLSPDLTKAIVDDRDEETTVPRNYFSLFFINGRFSSSVVRDGVTQSSFNPPTTYVGTDDVRDHVDLYITRTHVRIVVNGTQMVSTDVADMEFDRAYPYLAQVSYNPCKTAECANNLQTFHWDNVAFDGPKLPMNSLTPAGAQDVIFNAYSATACAVNGVAAKPTGMLSDFRWQSWVVRVPASATVTPADVTCTAGGSGFHLWDAVPREFEIVKQ